ncbi:pentapeptide repeat-containing protein [Crossiella sp. CA-258035]|uniref:pentapeptide repeat-containing protein n=1 Tax=Crossiella sp. CA-258035 TaxID=2981138 RepID=UPI0024BD49E4|nr:pentapeptide repeat-containing protein [Crossiella sp. CA-258035]WHT21890.1 pentapeptide repeat-containing protein [Crossiella sp. CA-258035]
MPDDTTNARPRFVPDWPTCTEDAGRCSGRRIEGIEQCLAHLAGDHLDTALGRFAPGADVDLRGTTLTPGLLQRLLAGMSEGEDPPRSFPRFGRADFRHCFFSGDDPQHTGTATSNDLALPVFRFFGTEFGGDARFDGTEFGGHTRFDHANFGGYARFDDANFGGLAGFDGANFGGHARFDGANFGGLARFGSANFGGQAGFGGANFGGYARFDDAKFGGETWFDSVKFGGDAEFDDAEFNGSTQIGPLVASTLSLNASFAKRAIVEVEAGKIWVNGTRFEDGVELRVRYAMIDMQGTFFGAPSSLSGAPAPFGHAGWTVAAEREQVSAWVAERDGADPVSVSGRRGAGLELWVPQLLSVQETDVSQLTLADVDLRWCRFTGAHQLDKLRLEGRSPFNRPPGWQTGLAWPPVWRWTSRRVLAEEHPWRARRRKSGGWTKALPDLDGVEGPPVGPERLAVVYRSLRKAFEDGKNEAGAGDFYYGEMEARRHAPSTGRAERALLTAY